MLMLPKHRDCSLKLFLSQVSKQSSVNRFFLWDSDTAHPAGGQDGGTLSQHAPKQSHMSAGWGQPIRLCRVDLRTHWIIYTMRREKAPVHGWALQGSVRLGFYKRQT